LLKLAPVIAGFVTGLSEFLGNHVADVGSTVVANPWASTGVGTTLIVSIAAASRSGRTRIACVFRRISEVLFGGKK
jgi:uncharacterized membrane protein YdcZ (DUF606 family)